MNLNEIIQKLDLKVLTGESDLAAVEPAGGYASDLLSCVMAKAQSGHIWVTLQAHPNVIAVASLLNLAAVVITEGVAPDDETVERARENGVNLLGASQTTFAVVGQLSAMGVAGG